MAKFKIETIEETRVVYEIEAESEENIYELLVENTLEATDIELNDVYITNVERIGD